MKSKMSFVLTIAALIAGFSAQAQEPAAVEARETVVIETKMTKKGPVKIETTEVVSHETRALTKDQVSALQKALTERGFYSGPVNGVWGDASDEAVRKYQADKGTEQTGALTSAELGDLGIVVTSPEDVDAKSRGVVFDEYRVERMTNRTWTEKTDIRKHGNGPKAVGKSAFMD